jgi:hypothetical protein
MPSSFCLWAVNAVSYTSYFKKINIPDRAKHSGNKPLTKIKKRPDNSSPLFFNHESLGVLTVGVAREIRNPLKCVNYAHSSVEFREKLLE